MSKKSANPKAVLEAVTTSTDTSKKDIAINVYPITLSRYAFLELLDSPFLNPEIKFGVNSIIPSAYVMCSDRNILKKYNAKNLDDLTNDAFDWADNKLEMSDIPEMIKAIVDQMSKLNKAAPSPSDAPVDNNLQSSDGLKKNQ